jgi:hypothetical protein
MPVSEASGVPGTSSASRRERHRRRVGLRPMEQRDPIRWLWAFQTWGRPRLTVAASRLLSDQSLVDWVVRPVHGGLPSRGSARSANGRRRPLLGHTAIAVLRLTQGPVSGTFGGLEIPSGRGETCEGHRSRLLYAPSSSVSVQQLPWRARSREPARRPRVRHTRARSASSRV